MTDTTALNRRVAKAKGRAEMKNHNGLFWTDLDNLSDYWTNGKTGPADSADVALRELMPELQQATYPAYDLTVRLITFDGVNAHWQVKADIADVYGSTEVWCFEDTLQGAITEAWLAVFEVESE